MAIEFPNLYKGNYMLLVAFPIALALVALLFIPNVKLGVEFRGGVLVAMQTSAPVDEEGLRAALSAEGFPVSSVKTMQNPAGYKVEVEIERDKQLTKAESLKSEFFGMSDELSRLESDAMSNGGADAVQRYADGRRKADEISNGLFAIAGMGKNASEYADTNDLKHAVALAQRKITDDHSEKLSAVLSKNVEYESASFNEVSASLSEKFMEKAGVVVIYSAIAVGIVVFLMFRTFVPSLAVLLGAACDVLFALGAMGLFGIPLTLASFAALLILIGFSLDTNVLLTMRVIKRRDGTARERAYEAMKTGTTMSMALLLSFLCLFALASLTHISTYYEISSVALAGLVGDLFATWFLNAPIVLHYAEKKGDAVDDKPFLSTIFSS